MTSSDHSAAEASPSRPDADTSTVAAKEVSASWPDRDATTEEAKRRVGAELESSTSVNSVEPMLLHELSIRNASALSRMLAVCGSTSEDDLMSVMTAALGSQHPDGSWGSDDYPIMKACFTAQILDALYHAGMILAPSPSADPGRPTAPSPVRRAVSWLRAHQQSDGSWGEDTWDTCQVLKALWKSGYREDDPIMAAGISNLRAVIDKGWPNKTTFWFGPGFMGGALEVLNAIGDARYAKRVLDELWKYFDEDTGSFLPPTAAVDSPRAPVEWHTANALKGLSSFGSVVPYGERTSAAIRWLKQAQTSDGSWSPGHFEITSFCTFEAIVALSLIDNAHCEEAQRGTQWFLVHCEEHSKPNLSTLLMAAGALVRTRVRQLVASVDFLFLYELADLLQSYSQVAGSFATHCDILSHQLESARSEATLAERDRKSAIEKFGEAKASAVRLQQELNHERTQTATLQSTIQSYALRVTGNQLAVIGVALTLITFAIGIIVALALAHN